MVSSRIFGLGGEADGRGEWSSRLVDKIIFIVLWGNLTSFIYLFIYQGEPHTK